MEVILIVHCLFNRVDVCRGYKLHIDFNFDYQQFLNGLDSGEAAQIKTTGETGGLLCP